MNKIILADRSRSVADWRCPRSRYLNYELDSRGIVPEVTSLEFFLGGEVHEGLAQIALAHLAEKVDIDLIAGEAASRIIESLKSQLGSGYDAQTFCKEQATLVEGLLRGFYKQVWPRLMLEYPRILAIEQEMTYPYQQLLFMSKPDLVIANEDESEIIYLEHKTSSTKKEEWFASWETAVQLHSTARAIKHTLGKDVTAIIIQGHYKGFESWGKQSSVMDYGYFRAGQPPFSKDQWEYSYKAGLKRSAIWEKEGGIKKWVAEMPEAILSEQFPQSQPIYPNDRLIEAFFQQRLIREQEIDLANQMIQAHKGDDQAVESILNAAFPQKFSECRPAWGRGCEFRRLCHGAVSNPLEEGFRVRESHHQLEREKHDAQGHIEELP